MNHLTDIEIKTARIKLFINALLIDRRGEINNTWENWLYEISLFLNLDEIALTTYNNIVNENSNVYLPKYNELLGIIININEGTYQFPENIFCRHMWLHLYH